MNLNKLIGVIINFEKNDITYEITISKIENKDSEVFITFFDFNTKSPVSLPLLSPPVKAILNTGFIYINDNSDDYISVNQYLKEL